MRSNQTELPIQIWYPGHDLNVLLSPCKNDASTLRPPGHGGESAIRTREGVTPVPLATGCLEPLGHLSRSSILQRRGWGSNPPALAGLPVFEAGRATLTRSPPCLCPVAESCGVEPRARGHPIAGVQSRLATARGELSVAEGVGIEPTSPCGFTGIPNRPCHPGSVPFRWSAWPGSNRRPRGPRPRALPLRYRLSRFVSGVGVEPTTIAV